MPSHFARFSSLSGNPVHLANTIFISTGKYLPVLSITKSWSVNLENSKKNYEMCLIMVRLNHNTKWAKFAKEFHIFIWTYNLLEHTATAIKHFIFPDFTIPFQLKTSNSAYFPQLFFAYEWPIKHKNNILGLAPVVMMVLTQCNVLHNVLYSGNGELCMDQIDLIDFPIDSSFHVHGSYTFSMLLIHLLMF